VKKVRWSEYEQSSLYACKEMKWNPLYCTI
jgi:hypothetical protein